MEIMKHVRKSEINGISIDRNVIIRILIENNSLFDNYRPLADQHTLKSLLKFILKSDSRFAKVAKSIILQIYEKVDIDLCLPFYLP